MRDKVSLSQGNVAWKSPAQKKNFVETLNTEMVQPTSGGRREKAFWMKSRMNSVESGAVYTAPL